MIKIINGRPNGTKNKMVTPKEKEKIILEYLEGNQGLHYYERKYEISYSVLHKWYQKYQEFGFEGLISKTGKKTKKDGLKGRPVKANTKENQLKKIILKQEIEIARLKKGYLVKGVGGQKEFVTTFEKNMK